MEAYVKQGDHDELSVQRMKREKAAEPRRVSDGDLIRATADVMDALDVCGLDFDTKKRLLSLALTGPIEALEVAMNEAFAETEKS